MAFDGPLVITFTVISKVYSKSTELKENICKFVVVLIKVVCGHKARKVVDLQC